MFLIIISVILAVLIVYLFLRLKLFENELKNITKQLEKYNDQSTNKKLDLTLFNKNIENLGIEINQLIGNHSQTYRQYKEIEFNQKKEIAAISHDFRTPLTSVLGYIQMAEKLDITEEERLELLQLAKNHGKRLEMLINDFFDLTIIESADYHLNLETIDIKNVLQEVIINYYDQFESKNINPHIDLPDQEVEIIADLSAVLRVLENIIANAIKYSNGDVNIYLKVEDAKVIVIMENDAPNLTRENVDQIFNRFYMADRSRIGYGSGLGLSIAQSYMKKMDGKICAKLENEKISIICEWDKRSE